MPEGPELRFASNFVNKVCKNRVFGGKPIKSEVSKNCEIDWASESYLINAQSRGKELMLILKDILKSTELQIIFHFGMSGNFQLTDANNLAKHAHLRFYTIKETPMKALSFVDFRRFGSWSLVTGWSPDRGPDPVYEHSLFRQNILDNLQDRAFKKPICETLLNQKYFNGIGNYLRAEILYRAGIKPFEESLSVLVKYSTSNDAQEIKKELDILQLCHDVPLEAINLNVSSYDPLNRDGEFQQFISWIQCYNKPGMTSTKDHNKRTIWFIGEDPGPLAPKKAILVKKSAQSPKRTPVKKEEIDHVVPVKKPKTKVKLEVKNEPTKSKTCVRLTRSSSAQTNA